MKLHILSAAFAMAALTLGGSMAMADTAFLQITVQVNPTDRAAAASVYQQYREPFLTTIPGALSKQLLIRDMDVQVLHGFDTAVNAEAYLSSEMFKTDVVGALGPLLQGDPEIRIYTAD